MGIWLVFKRGYEGACGLLSIGVLAFVWGAGGVVGYLINKVAMSLKYGVGTFLRSGCCR